MIRLLACAALLSFPQALVAAKSGPCLTRQEVGTLMLLVAPAVLDTAAAKCAAVLPPSAFLGSQAQKSMANAIRAEVDSNPAALRTLVEKLGGEKFLMRVKDAAFRTMMDERVGAKFTQELQVNDCASVDELASALSPLPPKNIGTIVSTILAMDGSDKKSGFNLCRPS